MSRCHQAVLGFPLLQKQVSTAQYHRWAGERYVGSAFHHRKSWPRWMRWMISSMIQWNPMKLKIWTSHNGPWKMRAKPIVGTIRPQQK